MAEVSGEYLVIKGGDTTDAQWAQLLDMAERIGATILERTQGYEPQKKTSYVGISDFLDFANVYDISVAEIKKAYVGLTRVAIAQQNPDHPSSGLPLIELDIPNSKLEEENIKNGLAALSRVNAHSLKLFVDSFDELLSTHYSEYSRIRLQGEWLPRSIGLATIEHYKNFVKYYFDKNPEQPS